jgi:hypothetical protein
MSAPVILEHSEESGAGTRSAPFPPTVILNVVKNLVIVSFPFVILRERSDRENPPCPSSLLAERRLGEKVLPPPLFPPPVILERSEESGGGGYPTFSRLP